VLSANLPHLVRAFVPASVRLVVFHNKHRPTFLSATESDTSNNNDQASTNTSGSCDVAIFGGGFGGLYTALALSRNARQRGQKLDIVLVEPSESFVFLPLLYDLTVGTATEAEVCPSYRELLQGTGIRHVRSSLQAINNLVECTTTTTTTNNNNKSKQQITLKPASPRAPHELSCTASVIAVGASPESILSKIPGAEDYAQPFYTAKDAKQTRRLLRRLEEDPDNNNAPRVAIVGGGFGGVELAASVKRKLPKAQVTLLSRGPPMAGTRAEPLVQQALEKLGVTVEECSVEELEAVNDDNDSNTRVTPRVIVKRKPWGLNGAEGETFDGEPWDSVMWTAGSRPSEPVREGLEELRKSDSGRLALDSSLRCFICEQMEMTGESEEDLRTVKRVKLEQPSIWALGDCAEIVSVSGQAAVPKTAQAAMQQADVVANNLLAQLEASRNGKRVQFQQFQYQDLGSMLSLGGPNAALMAPREGSILAPILTPILDTATEFLGFADKFLEATAGKSPVVDRFGLSPATLGLSLGSHGLGVESGAAPGTLAGTLTGAARRAVYAARMPTNRQRAVAATSAAISTAAALAKEAAARSEQSS